MEAVKSGRIRLINFRIYLLIFTFVQSVAVWYLALSAWGIGEWDDFYDKMLNGAMLPFLTRLFKRIGRTIEFAKEFRSHIATFISSIHFFLGVLLIFGVAEFHKMVFRWIVSSTVIWFVIAGVFFSMLVAVSLPLFNVRKGMIVVPPSATLLSRDDWAMIVLLVWLVGASSFVFLILRRRVQVR